jgi:hypothetical protein
MPNPVGSSKSCSKREVYSNGCLHQKNRKVSNNLMMHLNDLEMQELTKAKISGHNKDQCRNKGNKDLKYTAEDQ